jgi:hypothetical protein
MGKMGRRLGKAANLALLLGATICVALFIFLVWRHGMSYRYLAFIVAAAMQFAGMRLPESVKINAVFVGVSTLIALYFIEVILAYSGSTIASLGAQGWLSFPQDANPKVAADRIKTLEAGHQKFDTRSRLQVIHDMRARGIVAYPDIFPRVLFEPASSETIKSVLLWNHQEFLPVAGMSMTTTVFCNESGEYVVYESDEHGFHNPRGMWKERSAEIVTLGDSYTHGVCVPTDKGFVATIRSQRPHTINLGVNGHGPLTSLATLKEYGESLKPKLVLWFYYEGNDLRDLDGWEKNSPLLKRYVESSFSQHLIEHQTEIDQLLKAYIDREMAKAEAPVSVEKILKLHHLRRALHVFRERRSTEQGLPAELIEYLRESGAPAAAEDLQLFERVLAEARDTISTWGGRLVFVYLPTWERYRIPELASQDRDHILSIARRLNLHVVDLHKSFSEHPDPLSLFPFRRYAHYNELGHKLVGDEVLRELAKL